MICKFGISGVHRLTCRGGKTKTGAKHLHVHCTCTMLPTPFGHTAPSRPCQGVLMYRVWCPWLKVSLNRKTPRQKGFPPLARAAGTPHKWHPQRILSWYGMHVTCKFGIGGATREPRENDAFKTLARALHVHHAPQPPSSYGAK